MPKTRKCKNPVTFAGLHMWYKSMYEKLGWIVFAKSKGMHDKVEEYKMGLERLQNSIDCKLKMMFDKDKRDDLEIMQDHVRVLIAHAKHDF
jgi:hypothetical protein